MMWKRLALRLLFALPAIAGVVSLVFLLVRIVPGDPILALIGEQASGADRAAMAAALGLDLPWWQQLVQAWQGYLLGDWGLSVVQGKPVLTLIGERLGPTAQLGLAAMLVATAVGLLGGTWAALAAAKPSGGWVKGLLLGIVAVPSIVLGPFLLLVFAIALGWLPLGGDDDGIWSLILPAVTLGLGMGAALARLLAESLEEQLRADYVRTVVAKGGGALRVWGHGLRNALIPFAILFCLQVGVVLTGVVLTETVFGWPGVGTLLVEGLQTRDYPLVQGVMIVIAVGYVLANTLADMVVALLDPRSKQ